MPLQVNEPPTPVYEQPIPALPPLLVCVVAPIVTEDASPSVPSTFVKLLPDLLAPPPPTVTFKVAPALTE